MIFRKFISTFGVCAILAPFVLFRLTIRSLDICFSGSGSLSHDISFFVRVSALCVCTVQSFDKFRSIS